MSKSAISNSLMDPVLWGETHLINRDGSPRVYWTHQKEDLRAEDQKIIHLDGRAVGKTISLTTDVLHYAANNPGGKGLIATPFQGQLDSIIEEIEFQIFQNPHLLGGLVKKKNRPQITRSPYFQLTWSNQCILYFRPEGTAGGPFRSLHVNRIWVDEGAWLSKKAWDALMQCLIDERKIRIYSTPNGVRKSLYFDLTQPNSSYRVFHWPSWTNPNWTKEQERDLEEVYGGQHSQAWKQEVAGQHGEEAHLTFSMDAVQGCLLPIHEYRKIIITDQDLQDCPDENAVRTRLETLLDIGYSEGTFWIGGDLGYARDPAELVVLKENRDGTLSMVCRVHLAHVPYTDIAEALGVLIAQFNPAGIGLDEGGNGIGVIHELTRLDKFRHLKLDQRLMGFSFGGKTILNGQSQYTKEAMTRLLMRRLEKQTLWLPKSDLDVNDQFLSHTYAISPNGRIVYSKGNDHILDALRCAVLVQEQLPESDPDVIVVSQFYACEFNDPWLRKPTYEGPKLGEGFTRGTWPSYFQENDW